MTCGKFCLFESNQKICVFIQPSKFALSFKQINVAIYCFIKFRYQRIGILLFNYDLFRLKILSFKVYRTRSLIHRYLIPLQQKICWKESYDSTESCPSVFTVTRVNHNQLYQTSFTISCRPRRWTE